MLEVVKIHYPKRHIALISMEDRESRNTFSKRLIQGLQQVFNNIQQDSKVVVIQGYDNYFCCGGTQEELLAIQAGTLNFNDLDFYRLLLDCEIPTIAAMQGHAIGGGLAFACFADMMVFAEESLYSTNFMKYGFTPGMGATYMVPKKFGESLGREMLYSAKNFHGGVLKQRGINHHVVKREAVLKTALDHAEELADKPLLTLKTLKAHLNQDIKMHLPNIIEQELRMHQITFSQPEVKQRIQQLF